MAPAPELLLTVKEAATQLKLCPASVYRLCSRGLLAHVRIGNSVRIRPVDLAAFVEQHMA